SGRGDMPEYPPAALPNLLPAPTGAKLRVALEAFPPAFLRSHTPLQGSTGRPLQNSPSLAAGSGGRGARVASPPVQTGPLLRRARPAGARAPSFPSRRPWSQALNRGLDKPCPSPHVPLFPGSYSGLQG